MRRIDRRSTALLVALLLASTPASAAGTGTSQVILPPGQGTLVPPVPVPGDRFGSAVSVSNDTIVIGGIGVWVFRAGTGGNLAFEQRLVAPGQTSDFGASVDIDGDLVVVGDLGDSDLVANATARVFRRIGSSWQLEATLPPGGIPPYDGYGSSVAISGDTVVAAAPYSGTNHGLVYVFSRESGSWQQVAVLSATNPQPGNLFGADVDIDGNTLVVGAPGTRTGAWIFQRQLTPTFQLAFTFAEDGVVAPGPLPGGANLTGFGTSVAIDGATILVGRPLDPAMGANAGAVSVFQRLGPGLPWDFSATSAASDAASGEFFGAELAVSGDRALVGAPYDQAVGSVYVLRRNLLGVWEQETKLVPGAGDPNDLFGASVALDGARMVFGAPQNSDAGSWAGATYTIAAPPVFPLATDAFCFGDGGDGLGCTSCPCLNDAPPGTVGGCLNSAGLAARLASMGSASVTQDTLRFEVTQANSNTFASLISGAARTPLPAGPPCPPGSGVTSVALDGLRCVATDVVRHGTRATNALGEAGTTNAGWGPPSGPPGGLVAQGAFTAGQTRYFQVFYREAPTMVCGTGLNTTNAVASTVAP